MDWIIGLQKAIDYIEDNLTETIDYEMVAAQSFSSSYHFQRVFSILCGFTIGEYIRNRRLSLAGTELATSDAKVIDVALKYGYESPDSFAKAFQKFHGILPSQARNDGSNLKSFSRLVLKFSLEGGTIMNYRIETKPKMILLGYKRRFEGTHTMSCVISKKEISSLPPEHTSGCLKEWQTTSFLIIAFLQIWMMTDMISISLPQQIITNVITYTIAMSRE